MSKYERIIKRVFETRAIEYGTDEEIPFDRGHIEDAMEDLEIIVRNVPDIPYAYRSRKRLPGEIAEYGYTAVIIDDTRVGANPTYMFTKTEQLIEIPEIVNQTHQTSTSVLPRAVRKYIGKDEQGALTQVRYAGLLDDFTALDTYHLQSHLRMRVKGREAELDDLYVGVDHDGGHHALAVEAKGVGETLNKNQLIRNTRGIEQNSSYPDSVRTLAVKLDKDGFFYLLEFKIFEDSGGTDRVEMDRVWKYEFI
jgi:hypothetical protein